MSRCTRNGGNRVAPYGLVRIRTNFSGRVIWTTNVPAPPNVIGNPPLGELDQMLRTVITSGTGVKAQIPGYDIAGKTGTASDFKDAWFCGFTGGLTAVVWVGRDDDTPMARITGNSAPLDIWRGFMTAALRRLPYQAIPPGPPPPPIAPAPGALSPNPGLPQTNSPTVAAAPVTEP